MWQKMVGIGQNYDTASSYLIFTHNVVQSLFLQLTYAGNHMQMV